MKSYKSIRESSKSWKLLNSIWESWKSLKLLDYEREHENYENQIISYEDHEANDNLRIPCAD